MIEAIVLSVHGGKKMIVIYGAGTVGANAFINLYLEQSCIIIDITPLSGDFPKREIIQYISHINQIEKKTIQ